MQRAGWLVAAMIAGGLLGGGFHVARGVRLSAQGRSGAVDVRALADEVERLKSIAPTQSHVMSDVAIQYASLWFAAQKGNWPLATYYFNETRVRMQWAVRINPTPRIAGSTETVDLKGIFDGVDTGALAPLKQAIDKHSGAQFEAAYKVALESCYACHKAIGRPYLRPMVPLTMPQPIINPDPAAQWPQ
jgi:hypothetical protein